MPRPRRVSHPLRAPRMQELSTFPTHRELDSLCEQLEEAFARSFCDGSVQVARVTLLVRKHEHECAYEQMKASKRK